MTAPVAVIPIQQLGSAPGVHAFTHSFTNGGGENDDENYWQQASASTSTSTSTPPRPRPFLPAADLLFPPLFVIVAGIACWHAPRFLNAPLLLLQLIPCYVLGVFFFVVKLGGFSPPQVALPSSRLIAASAAALLCASFWSFAVWQLPLLWWIEEEQNGGKPRSMSLPFLRFRIRTESVALLACFSLFLVLQFRLSTADPGRVDTSNSSSNRRMPNHHAGTCVTCGVLRPLRSKHCRACNVCVKTFDHHCPILANCVGEATQAEFLAFLKVTVTGQFLMLRLALVAAEIAFGEKTGEKESASLLSPLAEASRSARGQLLLCIVQSPIFLSTVLLVLRGFFCAAANLTVNELAGRERYAYLRHQREGEGNGSFFFVNRFDRGVVDNLLSFFHLEGRFSALLGLNNNSIPSSHHDDDDHHWSHKLDAALAEHGPGGRTPPPVGTRVVRWLDSRKKKKSQKGGGEGKADAACGVAGAAGPSLDVELAPLWGEGGKGG